MTEALRDLWRGLLRLKRPKSSGRPGRVPADHECDFFDAFREGKRTGKENKPAARRSEMKKWARAIGLVVVCALEVAGFAAAESTPTISYQLRAAEFDNFRSAQLLVTVDVPASSGRVDIQFVAPPGFVVDPSNLRFDPLSGKRISAVAVRRTLDMAGGEYSILAHAEVQSSGSGSPVAVDQVVIFTYLKRLEVKFYFLLGLSGFVLGYLLRIVTGVLKNIPPPAPAVPANGQDGPLTTFVKSHYYRVDFAVSLMLAFIVLLYLMREGHPPDSASAWYGALLTGVGLGFLTNNDLLARIKS